MSFFQFCEANPDFNVELWKQWLNYQKDSNESDHVKMGMMQIQYKDLVDGKHSIYFYVEKYKYIRSVFNVWTGCYVKYLFEHNNKEISMERGWVDQVNPNTGFCRIQCDDGYMGGRAVIIRTVDIMEILPCKERFLIYYKTMLCGTCNQCDRASNEEVPISCRLFNFFNSIKNKQVGDQQYIQYYENVEKNF